MAFTAVVLGCAHSLLLPFLFLTELSGAKQSSSAVMMHTGKCRAEGSVTYPEGFALRGFEHSSQLVKIVITPLILLTAQAEEHVSGILSEIIFLDTGKKDKQWNMFSYRCGEEAFGLLHTYLLEDSKNLHAAITVVRALTLRETLWGLAKDAIF